MSTPPLSTVDWFAIDILPEGSVIPNVPCEYQYNEEGEFDRSVPKCGVVPTIKSEYYRHYFCAPHLQIARDFSKKADEQKKITRMLVTVRGTDFFKQPTEAIAYQVPESKQPRFRGYFGRAWDSVVRTERDEKVWVDMTWGHNGYFKRSGVWYRVDVMNLDDPKAMARLKAKGGQYTR